MYVYREKLPSSYLALKEWEVGYYKPDGEFVIESEHRYQGEATERVHYLNGGEV